ncbi:MAG TPA: threonylcarbamoyl-AMP synthase [Candidatus Aminicenantes bacterium]|nr:threonylcarbamoyl-AMP synthase [Candidatus Aminicenantes bacterium]
MEMKTRSLKINPNAVEPAMIRDIARVLAGNGVIVYPTDTFYGLGAKCFSQKALHRIFEIKKRPGFKGLPVLVSDLEMAKGMTAGLPPVFYALASRFWPGPLTIVLKAASHLPAELVGPGRTIGIRLPAVAWLQALIRETGVALVTTSANISGEGEIDSAQEVIRVFKGKVDLIVDGGQTPGGKPSTVIDLTGEKPILIREGVLGRKELEKFF